MPTPSLLIVPSRWKTGNPGKLYSQIPTNGNGDFNVTGVVTGGTSIGTRVNNLGYIEPITTSGTPRLDYYTSSGTPGCPALLVEPSGTNLCLQSEAFETSPWFLVTATSPNTTATTDPFGQTNADLFTATSDFGRTQQQVARTASGTHTISCFVKGVAGVASIGSLVCGRGVGFTITSGGVVTVNTPAGYTQADTIGVENYGNGWYRIFAVLAHLTTPSTDGVLIGSSVSGNSFYIFGAQVEAGSVATSYIPTTTGTVTRAAEVISVTGAVSGSIGQQSGTVYCEFQFNRTAQSNNGIFCVESTNNQNRIFFGNTSPTTCSVQLLANNSSIFSTSVGTLTAGQYYKIAVGYSSGNTKVYLNGNPVITNTSGYTMVASLSRICLGNYEVNPGLVTISRIRSLALYAERLTDADLMLLTMPGNNTYLPQAVWDNYLSRAGNAEVPDCLYTRHADLLDV